ncbi:hypothetical protein CR513_30679, partial [Mucuna pruriens]
MTYTALFPLLHRSNLIAISPLKLVEPLYLKRAIGHPTKKCWGLKHKENEPNVNNNPLPSHGGQSSNTISHK